VIAVAAVDEPRRYWTGGRELRLNQLPTVAGMIATDPAGNSLHKWLSMGELVQAVFQDLEVVGNNEHNLILRH